MPVGDFMTVREAAEVLGCTQPRVRQMLSDGTMRGVKAHERAWLIEKNEVRRVARLPRRRGGRARIGDA